MASSPSSPPPSSVVQSTDHIVRLPTGIKLHHSNACASKAATLSVLVGRVSQCALSDRCDLGRSQPHGRMPAAAEPFAATRATSNDSGSCEHWPRDRPLPRATGPRECPVADLAHARVARAQAPVEEPANGRAVPRPEAYCQAARRDRVDDEQQLRRERRTRAKGMEGLEREWIQRSC